MFHLQRRKLKVNNDMYRAGFHTEFFGGGGKKHVYRATPSRRKAGSTPQLFSHRVREKLGNKVTSATHSCHLLSESCY